MPNRARLLVLAAVVGLLAACQGPPEPEPRPAPGEPVQHWIRDLTGEPGRGVFMRNDSPTPVVITTVILEKCENLRQICGTYTPNAAIEPGRTVLVLKLEPLDQSKAYSFGYQFNMRFQNRPPGK